MNFKNVCVILPCFNEDLTLPSMVKQIKRISPKIEILVVDNSSTDDTFSIALKLGVNVVRENTKGKGYAVKKGFSSLSSYCQVVVLVDSDDTYDISNLSDAIKLVNDYGYDMVVGTRVSKGYSENQRSSVFRAGHKIGNLMFSKLSQILHPSGVIDSLSGFRVLSRNFVESFSGGASEFEIEAELNAHASFMKASVQNIEIGYQGRVIGSVSKLRTYRDGYKIFKMNFKIFRTYRPKLAYSLLALFWLFVSLSLGIEPVKIYFETGFVPKFPSLITSVGAFIVSIQLWNTGMVLERINVAHLSQSRNAYKNWSGKFK
jgi:glycosyltransferase involved in cell wall biosynthesis